MFVKTICREGQKATREDIQGCSWKGERSS